jgi:murein L,D-transpeptidase YafK
VYPFRLTTDNLKFHRGSPWLGFWLNLKEGFDLFEKYRFPPRVAVESGRYVFTHEYDQSLARIGTRD